MATVRCIGLVPKAIGAGTSRNRSITSISQPWIAMKACTRRAATSGLTRSAGVRGGQSIVLASKVHALLQGRAHVSFADLKRVATPALRHRLILSFEAEAEGMGADAIVEKLLEEIPELPDTVQRIAS